MKSNKYGPTDPNQGSQVRNATISFHNVDTDEDNPRFWRDIRELGLEEYYRRKRLRYAP